MHWTFDPITALITTLLVPILLFTLRHIRSHVVNGIRLVVDGIVYSSAMILKQRVAARLTLRRYCRLQLGRYELLSIPASIETKVPLDSIFVTLHLESQDLARTSATQDDLLSVHGRIIVIGEPGSGKSSLMKRLFRTACRGANQSATARLPLLVELKDLAPPRNIKNAHLGDWLYKHLRAEAARAKVYELANAFDVFAATSGLLILLDGLDEVSSQDYLRVERAICGLAQELIARGENNQLVLTMRAQFHQQVGRAYREAFGATMKLTRFTPSDIYEFLRRWPFPSHPEKNQTQLYKELSDRPTLRDMCRNPLVLSMYVAETQRTGVGLLPETRTDFYARVAEELLIRRRVVQGKGPSGATSKLREQRQRILGTIAFEHMLDSSQPANLLRWPRAVAVVREVVGGSAEQGEALLKDLAKETGILEEERAGQTFRFIHLTLCEYFAAFEAVEGQKAGWKTLLSSHRAFRERREAQVASRLLEVIPFASGLLKRMDREVAFGDLISLEDGALLARCFLETKYYEHPGWEPFVRSEEQALLGTPEELWDEEWLQRLHLFSILVLDSARSAEHMPSIVRPVTLDTFFGRLVGSQRSSLGRLLEAYAAQEAPAALRLAEAMGVDLARQFPEIVVKCCDQEPFFRLVQERALSQSEGKDAWLCLMTEAALRSNVVLGWMRMQALNEDLDEPLRKLDWAKRWPYGILPANFYGQCLALSLGADIVITPSALAILRETEPPPWYIKNKIRGLVAICPLILIGLMILWLPNPEVLTASVAKGLLLGGSSILMGVLLFMYQEIGVWELYWGLLLGTESVFSVGEGKRRRRVLPGPLGFKRQKQDLLQITTFRSR